MDFQKLLIKTAYWLIAISILVIIGLTIFSHHLIKKQSNNTTTETITKSNSLNDQVPGEDSTIKKDPEDIGKTYSGDFFQTD